MLCVESYQPTQPREQPERVLQLIAAQLAVFAGLASTSHLLE